jgi:branched-subunit amino acid aminotransferase/4-amino-4-deoxychorismate lyase
MSEAIWFKNGERLQSAPLYDMDHPFARWGDGNYDTQRLLRGRGIGAEHHARRLIESATATHTAVNPDTIEATIAAATLASAALDDAALRTIIAHTRIGVDVVCVLTPWSPPADEYFAHGRSAILSDIPHPGLGFLGKSLSYQYLKVAFRGATMAGADDALLCQGENVIESSSAALAWSDGRDWFRADTDGRGLRSTTADALAECGWAWTARVPTRSELLAAEEIVLLSGLHLAVGLRTLALHDSPYDVVWTCDAPDRSAATMRRRLLDSLAGTSV